MKSAGQQHRKKQKPQAALGIDSIPENRLSKKQYQHQHDPRYQNTMPDLYGIIDTYEIPYLQYLPHIFQHMSVSFLIDV